LGHIGIQYVQKIWGTTESNYLLIFSGTLGGGWSVVAMVAIGNGTGGRLSMVAMIAIDDISDFRMIANNESRRGR